MNFGFITQIFYASLFLILTMVFSEANYKFVEVPECCRNPLRSVVLRANRAKEDSVQGRFLAGYFLLSGVAPARGDAADGQIVGLQGVKPQQRIHPLETLLIQARQRR